MIYRRFTEKAAEEWRQIYKALQLLEYLIKHGSERVIDDARSHLTLLKMLRQFHFIDQNGKDQGVNVRNRAKELTELLGDVDRIRAERKKARANKTKYTGVEGGASRFGGFSGGGGSGGGGSSRYGGFGSESGGSTNFGGYSGGVYGDGGGFGGSTNEYGDATRRPDQFEEYDEFNEDKPEPSRSTRRTAERTGAKKTTPAPSEPPKKKEPEVDLFSFDDPIPSTSAAPIAPSNGSGLASLSAGPAAAPAANDDDEFDDFQSATPGQAATTQSAFGGNPLMTSNASGAAFAAPAPVSAPQQTNLNNMVGLSSISPPPGSTGTPAANYSSFNTPLAATTMSPQANKPVSSGYQASGPNYFTSVPVPSTTGSTPASMGGMGALKPVSTGSSAAAKKPAAGGDAFGALWANASGTSGKKTNVNSGPAMGQLAKEKSAAGIWGAPAAAPKPSQPATSSSSGLDDLLG